METLQGVIWHTDPAEKTVLNARKINLTTRYYFKAPAITDVTYAAADGAEVVEAYNTNCWATYSPPHKTREKDHAYHQNQELEAANRSGRCRR